MSNVITFIPKKSRTAQHNLEKFIEMARDVIPTWSDIPGFSWEEMKWRTTFATIRFINVEKAALHWSAIPSPEQLMHPEFVEAAKAYLRYRHHTKPHRNIGREMAALRLLEQVLRTDMDVPDITKVTQRHFDEAVALCTRFKGAAFIAGELLNILRRLADNGIVSSAAHFWTHRYHGDLSYENQNGAFASNEAKDKKLPDQDALLAIGAVFSRGYDQSLEDVDVMVTSITALLLCAPMRISEIRRFRTDCLAHDLDKDGKTQYYLKYWVPKTKEFCRKPIPETMAETAIEAVRRLTELTEEARRLARYMETNPTKFYRHKNCPDVPDDVPLTRVQTAQALGFDSSKSVEDYIKRWTGSRRLIGHTLNSLWQIVLRDHQNQNPHFPYQEPLSGATRPPLKMSESLLCSLRFQFAPNLFTSPVLLAPFNRDYYVKRLDASEMKDRKNSRPICFYTRHGFEPKKLKSHAPRHLLNRLAQQSGLTLDVITAWSSRSTFRQTLTYLDNDRGEAAATAASLMHMESEQISKDPVTLKEAEIYKQGPIHRSRYGLCRRSWRIGPCNKFADCLNCSELLMCKGDKFAVEIIRSERATMAKTFNAAQEAVSRGERSATRWIKVMGPQIKKLDDLIAVLNDPQVPDGSPVEIAGTNFAHEQTLINETAQVMGVKLVDRRELAIEYGNDLLECLDELKGPRGG